MGIDMENPENAPDNKEEREKHRISFDKEIREFGKKDAYLRCAARYNIEPYYRSVYVGFRCVR